MLLRLLRQENINHFIFLKQHIDTSSLVQIDMVLLMNQF